MFGLEKELANSKKSPEKGMKGQVKDHKERSRILQRIEKKIRLLKKNLTQGTAKEDFSKVNALLEGYLILQRVFKDIE
ncbi:DUF5398 family protein [Candidatus Similichlamydia epinepheli]|uniref:DUF5398 family protein n=1 Tax=Candidatus Similichlamydia epinepheli TaxID=1903953 RepID=UPI000D365EF6|nr:DUF5398 family protein [Candidatus Similichlamydia epinepheli]